MRRTGYLSTISAVASVDPSLTTTTSKFEYSSLSKPSKQSPMVRLPLYVQIITEIRGQHRSSGNGTAAKALRTLASAGFGHRSRSVRPKAQSSTSALARCHSAVLATLPLDCPGKHESSRASGRKTRADLPIEHVCLSLLTVS